MVLLATRLFPLLYGLCFAFLLWQAFRVMARGFRAASQENSRQRPDAMSIEARGDRTGQVTVHPELLDSEGRLTKEDLLTVRFGGDEGSEARPEPPETAS
ncbi:DUF2973 domain-containing protein [Synechococcus sp. RSCCF101]|uniref:DUF2973 domain-containing protein n=1 Tax=Synechococcus sp. RSCCF101 TaxID=2511069 RepID=UPI0012454D2C|nr:DUF2973 domain-containing protein [Synechococcus sp. RSCCF101]QEY32945.1 DUF2973 domain-containing protein [Synechococcus sp. RSCCF101]